MSQQRLGNRVPSATKDCNGWVSGYRLTFDKQSRDKSGKCDCEKTGNPDDNVHGVLYRIQTREIAELDRFEGVTDGGCIRCSLPVETPEGQKEAITYIAKRKEQGLLPYTWYKNHVLNGALENSLPKEYISELRKIEAKNDPDENRAQREQTGR